MTENRFPTGWDADRVRRVLEHHEHQTEDEAVTEDEAAWDEQTASFVEVPVELVPDPRVRYRTGDEFADCWRVNRYAIVRGGENATHGSRIRL